MGETNQNVWAPWRMEYIEGLSGPDKAACFLCEHFQHPQRDRENLVLRRSASALMVMNRFPYSSGHLLIAPAAHEGQLEALSDDVLHELVRWIRDAKVVLGQALHAQGFNVGMNIGHCAGAGLPDHLHWHIVPRWGGDTNFMPVFGDVKVIPEALLRTYEKLRETARDLGW